MIETDSCKHPQQLSIMTRDSVSLSRSPPTPFILRIPNEILYHILSFLPKSSNHESYLLYDSDGKNYNLEQILILRSVCRKFRDITTELDFWYEPGFIFESLLSSQRFPVEASLRPYHEQQFLKNLFSDASLVKSLGRRKTGWKFKSLGGLIAVMEGIPLFTQNAQTIYLHRLRSDKTTVPSHLNVAIQKLAACAYITKLRIYLSRNVDLDAITTSFPFLKILNCEDGVNYSGSLRELSCLRKLQLDGWEVDISEIMPLLPLNSAETLTELKFVEGYAENGVFNTHVLNAFINLKSLGVGPLCGSICDFIIGARIHLEVFEIWLIRRYVPINQFVDMLGAECLRNLKELKLLGQCDDTFDPPAIEQYWSIVFNAVTSILLSIEEIQLHAPLLIRCCPYFTRMINLKILGWEGMSNPYFGFEKNINPKEKMKEALDNAFVNFMEKPQIAVG